MAASQLEQQCVGYSPDSNDVSTEAEECALLRSVTGKRLVEECAAVICKVWILAIVL
jgi:hypothetical protein